VLPFRDLSPEIFVCHSQGAVEEIPQIIGQVSIVSLDEIVPGKISIRTERGATQQIIP